MTLQERKVMELALEALDNYGINDYSEYVIGKHETHIIDNAITAIKEALAQPEQSPVAFASHGVVNWIADKQFQHEANLYIAPQRTWVDLSDKEFVEACQMAERGNYFVAFQRIQAKLKDKNNG